MEVWQECLVERQATYVSGTVNAEAIHAHLDEASVAFTQILIYGGILGVEVNTISCYLTPLLSENC